jgi:predicted small lipoprotein YifL
VSAREIKARNYTELMNLRIRWLKFLALVLIAVALFGCGNKGDLVLPDPPPPAQT